MFGFFIFSCSLQTDICEHCSYFLALQASSVFAFEASFGGQKCRHVFGHVPDAPAVLPPAAAEFPAPGGICVKSVHVPVVEAVELLQVVDVFGDELDLYVDGGQTPSKKPSTVVDITPGALLK